MKKETPEEFAKRHDMAFCIPCENFGRSSCSILFSAHAHTGIECFKPRSSGEKANE